MARRAGIATIAVLALMLAPAAVRATHGPNDGPNHDFAAGGGTNGLFQIGLAAQSGPAGENPRGYVSARSRPNADVPVTDGFPLPFRFGGEVTCLLVEQEDEDTTRASIKYRFDHADDPNLVGGGIQIFVEDNGEPESGQTTDRTAFLLPESPATFNPPVGQPSVCMDPDAGAYTPGESGNIVVHDAP
jgi:hypothetical protein